MSTTEPITAPYDRARARFFTVRDKRAGHTISEQTSEQVIEAINGAVLDLAVMIETNCPEGRNKAMALTALEDAQIRAIRALFQTEGASA